MYISSEIKNEFLSNEPSDIKMEEIWEDIPGYNNFKASEDGRILSVKLKEHHLIKIKTGKRKKTVRIRTGGQHITVDLDKLVALAFVSNPNNCEFVYHRDGDRFNCYKDNLEWSNDANRKATEEKIVWITIKDFPNYEISKESIRNKNTKELLNPTYAVGGYPHVTLYNGKKYNRRIHILIAKHFISNPEDKPIVNHMDGNKDN